MSRFSELVAKMALEFPFELDTFQKEAIYHLENNESVFIAAHTSAGKVPISCSLSIYPSQSFLFGDLFSRIAFSSILSAFADSGGRIRDCPRREAHDPVLRPL